MSSSFLEAYEQDCKDRINEITGYWVRYKNGNPRYFLYNQYTPIYQCEMCGKLGPKRKIYYRNDCYRMEDHDRWKVGTPLICTPCWNKLRPVIRRFEEQRECVRLVNKLKREIANVSKNQDDGRNARVSGEHDDGREGRGCEDRRGEGAG